MTQIKESIVSFLIRMTAIALKIEYNRSPSNEIENLNSRSPIVSVESNALPFYLFLPFDRHGNRGPFKSSHSFVLLVFRPMRLVIKAWRKLEDVISQDSQDLSIGPLVLVPGEERGTHRALSNCG